MYIVKSGSLYQVLEVNPNLRVEVLALAEEYALVGPISDLYENILRADFKINQAELYKLPDKSTF